MRKNALMVLTHLILNDMMKVKGHIARMAMCLQVHLLSSVDCALDTLFLRASTSTGAAYQCAAT